MTTNHQPVQIGTAIHRAMEAFTMSVTEDEDTFGPSKTAEHRVNRTGTARDMAAGEQASGVMARRQRSIHDLLKRVGPLGYTEPELRRELGGESTGNHHGKVSGALSAMHRDGLISSLLVRRSGAYVYVTNEAVQDRPTREYGGKKPGEDDEPRVIEVQVATPRPHLSPSMREVVNQIAAALPGLKARHAAVLSLKLPTAEALVAEINRLDLGE